MSGRRPRRVVACAALIGSVIVGRAAAAEPARAQPERVLILPIDGPADSARDKAIGASARSLPGLELVGWRVGAARLAAREDVKRLIARAKQALARADQRELEMKRAGALGQAKQAIRALQRAGARLHARSLLIRAHLSYGLAKLLQPADEAGARTAFEHALALAPALARDPRRFSTRATTLLESARRLARTGKPEAPSLAELDLIAELAEVPFVLWIGSTRDGRSERLAALLYDRAAKRVRLRIERNTSADSERVDAARELVRTTLASVASRTASKTQPDALTSQPVPPRKRDTSRPWYRRWWVWTLVGAAVVGAGIGIGVAASQSSDPSGYALRFSFR